MGKPAGVNMKQVLQEISKLENSLGTPTSSIQQNLVIAENAEKLSTNKNSNASKGKLEQVISKTIKIFLASSSELLEDRDQFEIFINRENKELNKQGIFIHLERWEDFVDVMSNDGLQSEYNKAVAEADIFVSLFFTKVGRHTATEFEKAFGQFRDSGKPLVYTYFKDSKISTGNITKEIMTRLRFQEKLKALKHYSTTYKDINDLKYQFKMQLQKILPKLQ